LESWLMSQSGADAHDEVGHAGRQVVVEQLDPLGVEPADGALDLARVASQAAVLVQHLALVAGHVGQAEAVPDVGVLGGDAQRHLLAAAADQDRGPAVHGRRVQPAPALHDRGQRAVEVAQPVGRRAELVAVLVVVAPEPAGTDAEDEAPAGDVVDGARHVRLQVRVAVGVTGDQAADLDAAGRLRHRCLHRPGLEVRAVRIAVQRVEVIPVEHGVRAHLLHPHLGERALLRLQLDTDADRSIGHAGHCTPGR
jgi:hypothetical protein